MAERADLTGLLTRLRDHFDGDSFTVEDMIAAVEDRGFGPLLLIPALLVILPTGAVPGVPTLMALVNTLIAGQLILGRRHPWIPRRIARAPISRRAFDAAYNRAIPFTRRIDHLLYPRLRLLTFGPAPRLIACVCLILGLIMIPLELIPFAAAVPAAAIALLALGLSVRDGALIVVGMAVAVGGLAGIYFWQA